MRCRNSRRCTSSAPGFPKRSKNSRRVRCPMARACISSTTAACSRCTVALASRGTIGGWAQNLPAGGLAGRPGASVPRADRHPFWCPNRGHGDARRVGRLGRHPPASSRLVSRPGSLGQSGRPTAVTGTEPFPSWAGQTAARLRAFQSVSVKLFQGYRQPSSGRDAQA